MGCVCSDMQEQTCRWHSWQWREIGQIFGLTIPKSISCSKDIWVYKLAHLRVLEIWGILCWISWPYHFCVYNSHVTYVERWYPSWSWYMPFSMHFWRWFPFLKVKYVSCLEGIIWHLRWFWCQSSCSLPFHLSQTPFLGPNEVMETTNQPFWPKAPFSCGEAFLSRFHKWIWWFNHAWNGLLSQWL